MTQPSPEAVERAIANLKNYVNRMDAMATGRDGDLMFQVTKDRTNDIRTALAHVTALTTQLEAERAKGADLQEVSDEIGAKLDLIRERDDLTTSLAAATARAEAAEAERDRLRGKYESIRSGEWWYGDDETSSDACRGSPDEVIDMDHEPRASGVFIIQRAIQLPDLYAAIHVFTDDEKAVRQADDEYDVTYHLTRAEAEAALPTPAPMEGT